MGIRLRVDVTIPKITNLHIVGSAGEWPGDMPSMQ